MIDGRNLPESQPLAGHDRLLVGGVFHPHGESKFNRALCNMDPATSREGTYATARKS